ARAVAEEHGPAPAAADERPGHGGGAAGGYGDDLLHAARHVGQLDRLQTVAAALEQPHLVLAQGEDEVVLPAAEQAQERGEDEAVTHGDGGGQRPRDAVGAGLVGGEEQRQALAHVAPRQGVVLQLAPGPEQLVDLGTAQALGGQRV